MRRIATLLAFLILTAAPALAWEHWGGDRGGMRFSPLTQITPADRRTVLGQGDPVHARDRASGYRGLALAAGIAIATKPN